MKTFCEKCHQDVTFIFWKDEAYCTICGCHLKKIPKCYSMGKTTPTPMLPFGKYSYVPIKEIVDKQYLLYAFREFQLNDTLLDAIYDRLTQLVK